MADIGIKLGAEGAGEFKKAVADINGNLKVLSSELKLVSSEYGKNDKSVEGLTAKNKVLNKQIDEQKSKVNVLEQALKNSKETYGENSKETQAWTVKLNKAKTDLNNLEHEVKQNKKAMDEFGDETIRAGKAMDDASGKSLKFGDILKANIIGDVVVSGIRAVANGLKDIALSAFEGYAEYEQLVGGVDTLFKDNSAKVQQYATEAYKTAGMSANDYMETVTSFSASLLQSLGGDTSKAADAANTALIDMSDNANKMGTDMGRIQDAYQGFAKQNYTMLDNLKLGYGGTKTEMERLLADAQKLTGVKYDISNLNDVYSAIHAVQTELGITGTTANEASTTVQGSIGMLKTSWDNLKTGLGNPAADLDALIDDVGSSLDIAIENIEPIMGNIMSAVGKLVPYAGELISDISKVLIDNMPMLIDTGFEIATAFITEMFQPENIYKGVYGALDLVLSLTEALGDAASGPDAETAIDNIGAAIAQGIIDAIRNHFKRNWDLFTQGVDEEYGISMTWNASKGLLANSTGDSRKGHATGLDYVPFDNYPANLHKGEMVVPADVATQLRRVVSLPSQSGVRNGVSTQDLQTIVSGGVNALGTMMASNGGNATVPLIINGKELARAIINDLRSVSKSNPEVVMEF